MSKLSKYIEWNEALVDYFVRNGSTVWYVTENVIENIGDQYGINKGDGISYTDDFVGCCFSIKGDYNQCFQCPGRTDAPFLEDENESCTEDYLTAFDNHGKSIIDVYCASKEDRLEVLRQEVDIPNPEFNQIVEACIADYEERLKFRPLYSLSENGNAVNIQSKEMQGVVSLMDFALFLVDRSLYYDDNGIRKQFYYPYFSYLILVLLGFGRSNQQTWDEVRILFQNNGEHLPDNEHSKIAELFKKAIRDGLLNEHCTRTPDRYVKYLKYHSVLTPGKRNVFESVLYEHNISFGEGLHYNDIRNWIWRAAPLTTRRSFETELLKNENRHYFETLIRSFDRESYRKRLNAQNANNNQIEGSKGTFRFVVDTDLQEMSVWVEHINVENELKNDVLRITSQYILPGNFVVKVNNLTWDSYVKEGLAYRDNNYAIASAKNKDYYYFEVINGRWLVEVCEPDRLAGKPCFYVVRNGFPQLQHLNVREDTRPITRFFLPDEWHLLYTDSYVLENINDATSQAELNTQSSFARVVGNDAIRIDINGKRSYLAEAFPYIAFEGIEYANLTIKGYDSIDKHSIHFDQKQNGDRIYLFNIGQVQSGEIILEIYDDQGNRIDDNAEAKSHFPICRAADVPRGENKNPVKFNKWFCQTDSEDSYYSDNRVYPLQAGAQTWEATTEKPRCNQGRYENLMAVIYALGETRKYSNRKAIKDADLDTVIRYEADFRGVTLSPSQIKRLKYALCDLGILTHYYDNGHYYQTNSACLIPTGERYVKDAVNEGARGVNFYILGGAYSKMEYDKAIAGATYVEYVEQKDPLFHLLPPMIKVGYDCNQKLPLEENPYCTYDRLLAFAGRISDFENAPEYTDLKNREGSPDPNATNIPCMIPSNDCRGKRELLRIDQELILVNSNLSLSLLHNFVNYKHNMPIWVQRRNGDIYIKDEFDIPFYAKRALQSFSGCVAEKVFVFCVDDFFDFENDNKKNVLFETLITYPSPTGRTRTKFLNLLMNTLGSANDSIMNVRVPKDYLPTQKGKDDIKRELRLFAYKKVENGTNTWWLELRCRDVVVCYTDPDTRKVYCWQEGIFKAMMGNGSINQKLSKVIRVYDDMYNHNRESFYKNYGIEFDNNTIGQGIPSSQVQNKEEYEVIIMIK